MKIIEQYLQEVGRRLPIKARAEIISELRSLLMDELEQTYGTDAGEEEAKRVLADFGPPGEVARRYSGHTQVIAAGLTDLYFLIMKILLGAMAIAFTTVYIVELAAGSVPPEALLGRTLELPLQIGNAFLAGLGVLTLIFIAISRFGWNEGMSMEADWTPDELKSVSLEPESESRFSHIFSIGMSMLAIALLNVYPEVLTLAEDGFLSSGLSWLGHRVNIDVFRGYVIVFSVILSFEIVYRVVSLRLGEQTPALRLARTGLTLMSIVLLAIMFADQRLYLEYTSIVGFRLFVLIGLVGNGIELIKELVDYGKAKLRQAEWSQRPV